MQNFGTKQPLKTAAQVRFRSEQRLIASCNLRPLQFAFQANTCGLNWYWEHLRPKTSIAVPHHLRAFMSKSRNKMMRSEYAKRVNGESGQCSKPETLGLKTSNWESPRMQNFRLGSYGDLNRQNLQFNPLKDVI
ncbi:hypothetical protein SS50377_25160 [Spironucleus salmonicida]|uniref:Uncharacterized protein n=1 Tax=Spironucleus salmonicida TaxID=348837 RepID=A0A9P8LS47_9EUKA|nr:hypothetical protein SS50377_25160 [Spironucleus salmonicida]